MDKVKTIKKFAAGIIPIFCIVYVVSYVSYILNQSFIDANVNALPFEYQLTMAIVNFEPWGVAFVSVISIVAGIMMVLELQGSSRRL